MTVLAVGGAGYVGSHTVAALHAAGCGVVILDDFSNAPREMIARLHEAVSGDIVCVEGDACDAATIDRAIEAHGVSDIVHFAARKSVPESVAEPLRYYRANLGSTLALAAAAAQHGLRRIVLSSSAAVYGNRAAMPVTESAPADPASPYAATKAMSERILTDAAAAGGAEAVVLRYFNPVGAHSSGLLGDRSVGESAGLMTVVLDVAAGHRGKLCVFGADYGTRDGTAIRDFVHVADIAEAHVAALRADLGDHRARAYNLGSGRGTTVLELVTVAREATGRDIEYQIDRRRPGDVAVSWADCSRALTELGWSARRDLREMVRDHWNFQRRLQR